MSETKKTNKGRNTIVLLCGDADPLLLVLRYQFLRFHPSTLEVNGLSSKNNI